MASMLARERRDRPHRGFEGMAGDLRVLILSGVTLCFRLPRHSDMAAADPEGAGTEQCSGGLGHEDPKYLRDRWNAVVGRVRGP
jgi:hypothetical protein